MFRPVKRLCSSSPISGCAACDRRRRRVATDSYAVEVEGVAKRFGKQPALDGVSLRIRRGEVYGLLGPNGAGKTTLIRSLVGLVAPEQGTVTVLGRRMPQLAVLARVGYMTQQAALYPDLSAEENVRFFGAIHGRENGVREALEFVELWDRRTSVVSTLSGGMRTRCSLACALVHKPDLLLLDEPTVGVDPQLRVQLWDGFRKMAAGGTAIVVSSHVMDEAERCDRLGLIRFGKLLAEGTVAEIKSRAGVDRLEDAFLKLSGVSAS
ncbi:MAG: ABC transporter ATP-binding protein [Chloroflexi bacterium]|nr:MAG: ABC transporter ATP-binding protein [Chloroflexota bacterium]